MGSSFPPRGIMRDQLCPHAPSALPILSTLSCSPIPMETGRRTYKAESIRVYAVRFHELDVLLEEIIRTACIVCGAGIDDTAGSMCKGIPCGWTFACNQDMKSVNLSPRVKIWLDIAYRRHSMHLRSGGRPSRSYESQHHVLVCTTSSGVQEESLTPRRSPSLVHPSALPLE